MPGCSSNGLRPKGCTPTSAIWNGSEPESNTISAANTAEMMPSTITAPPVRRSWRLRSSRAMTAAAIASSSSQSRNEPCCPAQKPAMR